MTASPQRAGQERLAEAIRARRDALGLKQRDVVDAGGPALSTLRQIEAAKSPGGLSRETTLGLDRALRWEPGSAAACVTGRGEITPLDTVGWPTATGDWPTYVERRLDDVEPPASGPSASGDTTPAGVTADALQRYSDGQLIAELARRLAEVRGGSSDGA